MKNWDFYKALHGRGMTGTTLAAAIGCGRAHLTQVINGTRPGGHTWKKLLLAITEEEAKALNRGGAWRLVRVLERIEEKDGTMCHMEQETHG